MPSYDLDLGMPIHVHYSLHRLQLCTWCKRSIRKSELLFHHKVPCISEHYSSKDALRPQTSLCNDVELLIKEIANWESNLTHSSSWAWSCVHLIWCVSLKLARNWGPLYTRAWGPLIRDVEIVWLVGKLETVQLHFTARPWQHEGPKRFKQMKGVHGALHGSKWVMSHGLSGTASGLSKTCGSNAKLGVAATNQIAIGFFKYYIAMVGPLTTH